jgi:type IV secretion system protein TrbL
MMLATMMSMLTPESCTGIPDPAHPGAIIIDPACSGNGPSLGSQLLNDAVFGPFVQSASQWLVQLLSSALTFYTVIPLPDLGNADGTSLSPTVGFLRSSTAYISSALLVLSVIIGMVKMAVSSEARAGLKVGTAVIRYLVTVALSAAVTVALLVMGSAYSSWILDLATNGTGIGTNLFKLFQGGGIVSAGGYLVMLIIAALFAGFLLVTMLLRMAALPVMVGAALPLAAAASGTDGGLKAFNQLAAWTLAFCSLEAAVSTIMAAGFNLLSQSTNDGWGNFASGLTLLILACLALPSLLRILVPHASQMAGGRGLGSAALGAAATVVGLAAFGGAGKAVSAAGTGSPSGPMPSSGGGSGPAGSSGSTGSTPPPSGSGGGSPPPSGGSTPPPTPPAPPPPPPPSGAPPVSTWSPSPAPATP